MEYKEPRYFNPMDCDICGNQGCYYCHNVPKDLQRYRDELELTQVTSPEEKLIQNHLEVKTQTQNS